MRTARPCMTDMPGRERAARPRPPQGSHQRPRRRLRPAPESSRRKPAFPAVPAGNGLPLRGPAAQPAGSPTRRCLPFGRPSPIGPDRAVPTYRGQKKSVLELIRVDCQIMLVRRANTRRGETVEEARRQVEEKGNGHAKASGRPEGGQPERLELAGPPGPDGGGTGGGHGAALALSLTAGPEPAQACLLPGVPC